MNTPLEKSDSVSHSRRSFLSSAVGIGAASVASFSEVSVAKAANAGSQAEFQSAFRSILLHENEHVVFLAQALGAAARPKPIFQGLEQPDLQSFLTLARAFENTGAGAYLNALYYINSPAYVSAATSIALVEGRHAGFINVATSQPITLNNANFEREDSPGFVAQAVAPYVKSLNGGPPLTYGLYQTPANDIAILNFALALEYLEAEFYNINVPIFY